MKDFGVMIYFLWWVWGIGVAGRPETFLPLLPVMIGLTIFLSLFAMVAESGIAAQAKIMKELEHKHEMERKAFDHQAELNYRSQVNKFNADNASYFIDGLGRMQKK